MAAVCPDKLLQKVFSLSGASLPQLSIFYHTVSDIPLPHIRHLYPVVPLAKFKQDLDWLAQNFEFCSLEDWLTDTPAKKPRLLLTFDDGLRECFDVVAPVLAQKGIPAVFFVNSAFVDNKALMYRYKASLIAEAAPALKSQVLKMQYHETHKLDTLALEIGVNFRQFLQVTKPYLSLEQLKTLQSQGHAIGAHSVDHPKYYQLPLQTQLAQTLESIEFVKENFNINFPSFAFPFTDYKITALFFESLPPNTITFGSAGLKQDVWPNNYQRLGVEKPCTTAKESVGGEYFSFLAKRCVAQHKIKR